MNPNVESFYDPATFTFTYVVYDRDGGRAAIVDPVLDFDPASARTSTVSADRVLGFVRGHGLTVDWILETHAHADHLTAAAYLKRETGAKVAIGRGITQVQARFKALFGLEPEFATDGRQFDRLFADGDTFAVGALEARVVATPGHTDDSLTYVIGDAAFVGDTVFAPETGTARAAASLSAGERMTSAVGIVAPVVKLPTKAIAASSSPFSRNSRALLISGAIAAW